MPDPLIEKKVKEVFDLAQNSLSKKEVLETFKIIIEIVKKNRDANQRTTDTVEKKLADIFDSVKTDIRGTDLFKEIVESIKSDAIFDLTDLKNNSDKTIKEALESLSSGQIEALGGLDTKLLQMKSELTPDNNKISRMASEASNRNLFPRIMGAIKKDLSKLGSVIVDALEKLPKGKKLKIKAIENLQEELDKLKREMQQGLTRVIGGSGQGGTIVKSYDLSGDLDGATKTFTLPAFFRIIDVKLWSGPVLRENTDYTVDPANSKITFTDEIDASTLLATNQSCIVIYSE